MGESILPEGWLPVAAAALACVVTAFIGLGAARRFTIHARWTLTVCAWLSGAALICYSFLFPVSLLRITIELFGTGPTTVAWTTAAAQGSGVIAGILAIACAITEQRRARRACPRCGRIHGRSAERRTDPTPRWVYVAGYLVLASCATRLTAELMSGVLDSKSPDTPWALLITVVIMLILTGTLLPLALVHRWGRIWPRWVPWLAGSSVPRWVVLGPALFIGAGLTGYFGIGGMTAWATGNNLDGPLWALLMVLPTYTFWGVGLLVAAVSYSALTKPPCPIHARRGHILVDPDAAEPAPDRHDLVAGR